MLFPVFNELAGIVTLALPFVTLPWYVLPFTVIVTVPSVTLFPYSPTNLTFTVVAFDVIVMFSNVMVDFILFTKYVAVAVLSLYNSFPR